MRLMLLRPNGTVSTYTCIIDTDWMEIYTTRICDTGNWTGTEPACMHTFYAMYTCMIVYVYMYMYSYYLA